jgi:TatA/E family protein of Tat protein translocase
VNLGLPELLLIFVVTLLLFGPKRLPDIAKALGKGIRDFKRAVSGEHEPSSSDRVSPPTEKNSEPDRISEESIKKGQSFNKDGH